MDLTKVKEKLEKDYPSCKIIYLTLSGSKLHGTATENSDTDIKGLFIPSVESIILNEAKDLIKIGTDVKNTSVDVDYEIFSFDKFMGLILKGDAGAVDLLFSMFSEDTIIYESEESQIIKENFSKLICNKTRTFVGFAISEVSKYSLKGARVNALDKIIAVTEKYLDVFTKNERKKKISELEIEGKSLIEILEDELSGEFFVPTVFEGHEYFEIMNRKFEKTAPLDYFLKRLKDLRGKYGARAEAVAGNGNIDFKAFGHAIRVLEEVKELLATGFITFPRPEKETLLLIKKGKIKDIAMLSERVDELVAEVDALVEVTTLPSDIELSVIKDIKSKIYNIKGKRCSTFVLDK